jgi:hypothetical protein
MTENKWSPNGLGSYYRYTTYGSDALWLDRSDGLVVSAGAKYMDMPANVNILVPESVMVEYLEKQGYVVRKDANVIPFRKVNK